MGNEFWNRIEYGKEAAATHGTPVAATKYWIGQMPAIKTDRRPTYPKEHFGVRADAFRGVIHQYLYENTLQTEHGAFQHLPLIGGCGVKGNVTAVEQTGGQGDYLWDLTPNLLGANNPDSFTTRFGDNVQAYIAEYCMVQRIRLSGQVAQGMDASPVNIEAEFFGRQIQASTFTSQLETATIVGTITQSGNATVTITAAGMNNSPKAISVAVLDEDTAAEVATKIRTALNADTDVTVLFTVGGTGADVTLTKKGPGATDATLNIAYTNGTCLGLTPDATSTDTSGNIALPTLEPMNAKLARLYLDTSWATVGNTELANLLRTFDIEILTGVHPNFAGSASRTFNAHGEGVIAVMGTFGIEAGADAASIFSQQQDGDFVVARLAINGSQIGSGDSHSCILDFSGSFEDASPISGADRGDNLATMVLHNYYDKTAEKLLQWNVTTDINAY